MDEGTSAAGIDGGVGVAAGCGGATCASGSGTTVLTGAGAGGSGSAEVTVSMAASGGGGNGLDAVDTGCGLKAGFGGDRGGPGAGKVSRCDPILILDRAADAGLSAEGVGTGTAGVGGGVSEGSLVIEQSYGAESSIREVSPLSSTQQEPRLSVRTKPV
jgi:hypothetical protein